jgi:hypothetical protein
MINKSTFSTFKKSGAKPPFFKKSLAKLSVLLLEKWSQILLTFFKV